MASLLTLETIGPNGEELAMAAGIDPEWQAHLRVAE
jgi:hypothetical protein